MIQRTLILLLVALACTACVVEVSTPVVINEIQSNNLLTLADGEGEFDDWIELYNVSDEDADLSGYYLSDNALHPTRWIFPDDPDSVVPAGGHLLVWTDGDNNQGNLHANFRLRATGEEVGLYSPLSVGLDIVDRVEFDPMEQDYSFARIPDGGPDWTITSSPTPGATND
jgi:hypothetical protein